jgi:hypothetical protein
MKKRLKVHEFASVQAYIEQVPFRSTAQLNTDIAEMSASTRYRNGFTADMITAAKMQIASKEKS